MNSSCLACRSEMSRVRPYRTDSRNGRRALGRAWLYECRQCKLVQAAPLPTPQELADYYAVDYRRGGYYGSDVADASRFPKDNLFYFNRGQSIAELVSPYVTRTEPRVLDIGAGYGHILHSFGRRYPNSTRLAIEFSNVCVDHLCAIGVHVETDPVEKVLPRREGQFDAVVISHVLEHLMDPLGVLRMVRRSLVDDGVLFIEVPNIPADSLTRYPDHVWAPRYDEPHITFFSLDTLRGLLETAGFRVEFCETAGPFYKDIPGWRYRLPAARWLVQRWMPARLFHFLRRQSFTKPARVQEREESFYQYGGFRIWIRSIARKSQ